MTWEWVGHVGGREARAQVDDMFPPPGSGDRLKLWKRGAIAGT